jgi:hypothetical protein
MMAMKNRRRRKKIESGEKGRVRRRIAELMLTRMKRKRKRKMTIVLYTRTMKVTRMPVPWAPMHVTRAIRQAPAKRK